MAREEKLRRGIDRNAAREAKRELGGAASEEMKEERETPEDRRARREAEQAQEAERENEASRLENIVWIRQQRAGGTSDEEIITALRDNEWEDTEIIEFLTAAALDPTEEETAFVASRTEDGLASKTKKAVEILAAAAERKEQDVIDSNISKRRGTTRDVDTRSAERLPVVRGGRDTVRDVDSRRVRNPFRPDLETQAEMDDLIAVPKPKEGLSIPELEENASWARVIEHTQHLQRLKSKIDAELAHTTDESEKERLLRLREDHDKQAAEAVRQRLQLEREGSHRTQTAEAEPAAPPAAQDKEKTETTPVEPEIKAEAAHPAPSDEDEVVFESDLIHMGDQEEPPQGLSAEEERQWRVEKELSTYRKEGWVQDMPSVEKTPLEWSNTLRELVKTAAAKTKEGAVAAAVTTKEKVQWWKSAEEGLIRRSAELDREVEQIGGFENFFRKLGENYNSLGWKTKLAIGAGLGIGAAASSAFMFAPALALCLTGVAAQRTAGLMSMYMKFEKISVEKGDTSDWLKEKAMAKALLYSAGMTGATLLAIKEMKEVLDTPAVHTWLGKVLHPGASSAPEAVHTDALGDHTGDATQSMETQAPEVQTPMASHVAAPAVPAVEASPAVPLEATSIDVAASKGHGYEYMAKRLWEQLQEKHVQLPANAKDSDLATLLRATPKDIDKVVHDLAQNNKFFHEHDGSVRIDLGSHMRIDSSGNIVIDGTHTAPDAAPVTPTYHAPATTEAQPYFEKLAGDTPVAEVPDTMPATVDTIDIPVDQHALDASPAHSPDASSIQAGASSAETSHAADIIVNKFEVTVPLSEPNLYTGTDGRVYAYGGTSAQLQAQILKYLTVHPETTITTADPTGNFRVESALRDGKLLQSDPMKARGWLPFLKVFMPPPGPDEFKGIVS